MSALANRTNSPRVLCLAKHPKDYRRCEACHGYFDLSQLKEYAGRMICRYCLNDLKKNLPGGSDV